MPPKKKVAAPIDRPLSRAYLREFAGWSTAFPPGLSEPNTLRLMENILINRDGSARVRPGLRLLSYDEGHAIELPMVGSHEAFYLNDGTQAYLFAVREVDGTVTFRVGRVTGSSSEPWEVESLSAAGFDSSAWAPYGPGVPWFTSATTYVKYVQIDNKLIALSDAGEPMIVFYVGTTKKVPYLRDVPSPVWHKGVYYPYAPWFPNGSAPNVYMSNTDFAISGGSSPAAYPPAGTLQPNSLISSNSAENIHHVGFFYTYSNELGETGPSNMRYVKTKRPWGQWDMHVDSASGTGNAPVPTAIGPLTPENSADHLVVTLAADHKYTEAAAAGATHINFYMMTWSDQAPMPPEAVLVAKRPFADGASQAWAHIHPAVFSLGQNHPHITNPDNIVNTAEVSKAGQALVASDRLVLVKDPTASAVIRWTGNDQGNYLDFSPLRGGGYKTLTSGNMQIPACVKLWQNPQSVDTLTILNKGTDGHSTSYYMAPAQVASQSDATNIMGFEETTATPGTVSPYGCEVANNALYHPLDDQLMKSTASNYNINHKEMTELVANMWRGLSNKGRIVSCFHDQRLYYLVHNPEGAALEAGCWGNEVWILDLASKQGAWSRWLVQGCSMRKVSVDGRLMVSLTRPDGVFAFDELRLYDEVVEPADFSVVARNIPWLLETNTQGANRAHDAWAHLRQVSLMVGNFSGTLRYGVRGWDVHGQPVDKSKLLRSTDAAPASSPPFDLEDHLQVARDMKEWFFYAESVEEAGVVLPSQGQLSLVQYRYTPVSVNVGYEYGSIETFEYGRAGNALAQRTTDNGIPMPMIDTRQP